MNFEWSVARISSVRYDESVEERLDGSVKAIGHGPLLQHPLLQHPAASITECNRKSME